MDDKNIPAHETRRRNLALSREGDMPDREAMLAFLPAIPKTASPVPWLTSIHAIPGRRNYGDSSYPGNCSGLLIRDLLMFFRPARVLDPMAGGCTCSDVCAELGIPCFSLDLKQGHDATDPDLFCDLSPVDFVWMHPPYWRMVHYSDDPRCLSNAPTLSDFLERLRQVIVNCRDILTSRGRLAILIGDAKYHGEYLALPFRVMDVAMDEGLSLACPEIVRFSHGATSSRKEYSTSFIPRLHDICLVLQRGRKSSSQKKTAA